MTILNCCLCTVIHRENLNAETHFISFKQHIESNNKIIIKIINTMSVNAKYEYILTDL